MTIAYSTYGSRTSQIGDLVDNTITYYTTAWPAGNQFDRQDTIINLLKRLKTFAQAHFDFFYTRLIQVGVPTPPLLSPDNNYPPETVLFAIVKQASRDLEAIMHAATQRQQAKALAANGNSLMLSKLQEADVRAYDATRKVLGKLLQRDPNAEPFTVLAYFQKERSIRVIPYAPVALVGIPFGALGTSDDFLAIPHEIGHYVFWHGKEVGKDPLRKILREMVKNKYPKWIEKWLEEIFADVYGCCIEGPPMAADFQNLSQEYAHSKFFLDDGEHPSPFIRPEVYHSTLDKIISLLDQPSPLAATVTALRNNWISEVNKRVAKTGLWSSTYVSATTLSATLTYDALRFNVIDDNIRLAGIGWTPDGLSYVDIRDKIEEVVGAVFNIINPILSASIPSFVPPSGSPPELPSGTVVYPDCLHDVYVSSSPPCQGSGSYGIDDWRLWVFANGWTDGPNGMANP